MHFHVARMEFAINFGFPAGVSCFNCPYKIIKIFPRLLSFYLRRFSESRSSNGSTSSVPPSVRPSVRLKHFRGTKFV